MEWSESLYRLFGLDPALPAPSWSEQAAIYTPESYRLLSEAVGRCLETGDGYHLRVEGIHCDGARLDLEATGNVVRSESGAVVGIAGVLVDLRKELSEEERFRAVADYSPDWESWFSPEGQYLWVSSAVEPMTGYTRDEILAITDFLGVLIAPDHYDFVRAHFIDALQGRSGNDVEFKCVRKDGSQFWVSGSWQMIFDAQGKPLGVRTSKRDISRRKSLEEQFAEKNRLLSTAGRIARVASWVIDAGKHEMIFSDEARAMFQLETGSPRCMQEVLRLFVPSSGDQEKISAALHAALTQGAAWDLEIPLVTARGRQFWGRMVGEPAVVEGSIVRIEGIFQDISDKHESLEELLKFRQLIDGLGDYIYFKDNQRRFELVNAHILRLNGFTSQAQIAGKTDYDFEDPKTADHHRREEEEILRTGKPLVIHEETQQLKGDEVRWFSTTKIPRRNSRGEIVGLMGLSRDITDLKRREFVLEEKNRELKRLHQSENIQRLIAANLAGGIGIWEWNLQTNELICNAQTYRLYGVPEGSFTNVEEWLKLLAAPDRERMVTELNLLVGGAKSQIDAEFWIYWPDGSRHCLRALGFKQVNDDGQDERMVGTLWDMTREKAAREEIEVAAEMARQASEAKSNFLANISHEIRTPLNAIIGMSDLLLQNPADEVAPEMLHTIQQSGNMLLSLISGVLDLAKIEADTMTLHDEPFDLGDCLEQARNITSGAARLKGIDLRAEFTPDFPGRLQGDRERLMQIVVNLLNNAIKFTPSGTVTLSGSLRGGRVSIEVRDTGIGIAPEDQKKLFQNFTQIDPSAARIQAGAGLGLALSKKLAGLMGGTIELESTPGVGSTFRVLLPLSTPSTASARAGEPVATVDDGRLPPLNILIVEDNPVNLRVVTLLVERLGMRARRATNGREALEILTAETFDAVLMDIQMPEMDGVEVTRRICERYSPEERPRIIALTANATVADRRKCLEAGMDDFLTKPIKTEQLAAALRQVVLSPGWASRRPISPSGPRI